MNKKNVKVIGERNCGTNLVEQLIQANLAINLLKFEPNKFQLFLLKYIRYDFMQDLVHSWRRKTDLGWKHGIPRLEDIARFNQNELAIVSVTKNPYAFLISLYRRPYHFKGTLAPSFLEFIQQPWITRNRDNTEARTLNSPVELWNIKNAEYVKLQHERPEIVHLVRYETMIEDPFRFLNELRVTFELAQKNSSFSLIEASTKGDKHSFSDYQNYYGNEIWKNELSAEIVAEINKRLDHTLVSKLDYHILSPSQFYA